MSAGGRTSGPGPAGAIIDRAALREQMGGDVELLREVVSEFGTQRGDLLARLERGLERGDTAELVSASHTLRGSLLVLGAGPAIDAAYAVERTARAGDLAGSRRALDALRGLLVRLAGELDELARRGFDTGG